MGKKFHYYSNDFYCKVQVGVWLEYGCYEAPVSLTNQVGTLVSLIPCQRLSSSGIFLRAFISKIQIVCV